MRLLRRAWAPLPVSALALSSIRGSSKRTAAAATTATSRARTSAWIPGLGLGRGRWGVDGELPAATRQLKREAGGLSLSSSSEPLVQKISDELQSIRGDLKAHAVRGADSPVISKVLRLMDRLEPQDLGMKKDDFDGLERSLCIPVVVPDIDTNQEAFEITIFVIPEGGELPLHDHPHMTVLSKILFGSLHVDSYDLERASRHAGEEEARALSPSRSEVTRVCSTLEGEGQRYNAVSSPSRVMGAATSSFLLTPAEGNVHAFKASATCAVFDILIPPYDSDQGRSCTFYRVETPSSPGTPPVLTTSAEDVGGGHEGEEKSRRVVLQEIPEPEDLPLWGEYNGPVVTLR